MVKASLRLSFDIMLLLILMLFSGCTFFDNSGDSGGGRSVDPRHELFVIHSLAETISSVALNEDGSFGPVQSDVQYLGAVPNHLLRLGDEIVVTLSGQNELLRLDENTLRLTARINQGAGSNPMETVNLYPAGGTTSLADGLLVTTHLFGDRLRIDDTRGRSWTSGPPWTSGTGVAPQALLALPGSSAEEVRLLVANTAFSTSNFGSSPFGNATVTATTFRLSSSGGQGTLQRISTSSIDLEQLGPGSGTNPTALIDAPALDQVLVIGSGDNYGSGDTNDGSVTILCRDTLAVESRIEVGDSPGSGVLRSEGTGHRLYVAGPSGIKSIYHDDNHWESAARQEYDAASGGGNLPFIADVAGFVNTVYAADFANSRILAFTVGTDGALSLREAVSVSQGPVALLVDIE